MWVKWLAVRWLLNGACCLAFTNALAGDECPPESDPSALDHWQTQHSLPFANDLLTVTFGNGRFAGGGTGGRLVASTNAADWNVDAASAGFVGSLDGITYADGLFVGVSSIGGAVRSTDGISWQVGPGSGYGITYGYGRFVSVGRSGGTYTSTNATNWVADGTRTNAHIYGVAYGGGTFVAVGLGGGIWLSTNGMNWKASPSPTNQSLFGITFSQGQFVAVGTNGAVQTSTNGIDWSIRASGTTHWLRAVTYADHLFVAVGNNGTIITSPDAVNWDLRQSDTTNHLSGVTYGHGVVVVFGARGTVLVSDPLYFGAPSIVSQPPPGVTLLTGASTSLDVAVFGTGPRYFQWLKDDVPISGASNEVLNLSNLEESDSGRYTVSVSNRFGSSLSDATVLFVASRVGIVQPPLSQSVVRGGNVTISVLVTGTPPYSFEWRHGPTVLASNVVFEPFSVLTLTNIQASGAYQVRVRNPAPFMGVAGNFSLTVLTDSDSDGLPDAWETAYGFDADNSDNATADPDQDGFHNLAEYEAGTDPTNNASYFKIDAIRLAQAADAILIDFSAVSNRTYTLLARSQLLAGSWSPVAEIIARSANRTVTVTNSISSSETTRFYRLVTPHDALTPW